MPFKGNTTTALWASMGVQYGDGEYEGVVRDGQACYISYYPKDALRHLSEIDPQFENDLAEPSGPINLVNAEIKRMVEYDWPEQDPAEGLHPYQWPDGIQAGLGWIYAASLQAKRIGCTLASAMITTNDGNWFYHAYNPETGVGLSAVFNTYYGT